MHSCATQEAHGRLLQAKADLADASWQHSGLECLKAITTEILAMF